MASRVGVLLGLLGLVAYVPLRIADWPSASWASLLAGGLALSLSVRVALHTQIAAGVVLGAVIGAIPHSGVETTLPAGRIFIAMLRMLVAPLILFSITAGVARMGDARKLGTVGIRTVAIFALTSAIAVATGLALVNTFRPGADGSLRESGLFRATVGQAPPPVGERSLSSFLLDSAFGVLANPFQSLAEGQVLPIVVFSILLGLALVQLRPETSRAAIEAVEGAYAAIMKIVGWFVRLAPVGVFVLIGHLVATVGFRTVVENLLGFAAVVVGGTLFHGMVTLPGLAWLLAGARPGWLLGGIRDALWVALSTSSSAATLPVTTRCVEDNLGVPSTVSSFVLPLGTTVNMDGTALYEAVAALFVANVYGVELGVQSQLVVALMAMLMAVGAPGIPSAGMVTMIVVLEAVGLPVEAVALLISIDRFLDTVRTMVNVEGDAVVAVCVSAYAR